jgi:Xaa-Pro aminopeptidase
MLDPARSRQRAQRVAQTLSQQGIDALVCGHPAHVYYFTAHLPRWMDYSAAVVFADGHTALIKPHNALVTTLADEVIDCASDWFYTLRQEQPQLVSEQVQRVLKARHAGPIAADTSTVSAAVGQLLSGPMELFDAHLWQMRRRKDIDELALMDKAIACAQAMFDRARQIIQPGVAELEVFNQLHAAAVAEAGEPLSAQLGNDFACGCMGGPPRPHRCAAAGEIYILDVGPAYRGYFADLTRSFAVGGKPTDEQLSASESLAEILALFERIARPGVRCRDIWAAAEDHLRAKHATGFAHHLGHGVGLQPHEFPHLNPHWDDVLAQGDVVTVEPGLYARQWRGGLRLENQYLITETGCRSLSRTAISL